MRKICEDFIGTCQACLGEFKVGDDGRMVLHGFKRPGDGYTHGQCRGTDHAPYEHDRTLTGIIAQEYHDLVESNQKHLADLNARKIKSFYWFRKVDAPFVKERRWEISGFMEVELMTLVNQDHEMYEELLKRNIYDTERNIRIFTAYAKEFDLRYSSWKRTNVVGLDTPPTDNERYLRLPWDPDRIAEEEAKSAKKAERDAKPGKLKLVFYYEDEERHSILMMPNQTDAQSRVRWNALDKADKAFTEAMNNIVKPWAKTKFKSEKTPRITEGSEFDISYKVRKALPQRDEMEFRVVVMNIDWSYLDQIKTLYPDAIREDDGRKKVAFYIRRSPFA